MGEHPTMPSSRSVMSDQDYYPPPHAMPPHAHASHNWPDSADNYPRRQLPSAPTQTLPSIYHHDPESLPPSPPPIPNPTLPLRYNNVAGAGLQIRTDLSEGITNRKHYPQPPPEQPADSAKSSASPLLTPALRHTVSASSLSPNSALASPALAAMIDITPLPSPLMLTESSPGPWKRIRSGGIDLGTVAHRSPSRLGTSPPAPSALPPMPDSPHKKKKSYGNLIHAAVEAQAQTVQNMDSHMRNRRAHTRNRSISDFVPEVLHNVRPRNVTVGPAGLHLTTTPPADTPMQREHYLAQQRGMVQPSASENHSERRSQSHPHTHSTGQARASVDSAKVLPSPPASSKGLTDGEVDEEDDSVGGAESSVEYFSVRSAHEDRKRRWRAVRCLGQGTFSRVVLATSQQLPPRTPYDEAHLDPRKLVAVKIVEHGPAGGADEERIEVSLKREVDILKSVSHPSIVQLKALEYTDERALLVLSYCPGGDLFELASERRDLLQPAMVQRMFAELVGAVRYLHQNYIVHRDIKLENVLVVPTSATLSCIHNPQAHRYPLICLTDLGLSRRISQPPASPLLTTRCGSEDYAAPEILLGQPYDGRSTDGWALGVLLYALMEGRLPFDCPPGKPERSKPSHRIARADWIWCKFGDEDGEWDETKEWKGWEGARGIVEGLLKKVRMGRKSLVEIEDMEWVKEGIKVPGGIRLFDDTEPV